MADVIKRLGKDGKITLVYTPQMPEQDVLALKGKRAMFSEGRGYRASENPTVADQAAEKLRRIEQYPVPPEKVLGLAAMIKKKEDPKDIVAYLLR